MTRLELRNLCLDWLDDPQGTYFTAAILNQRLDLATRELQKRLLSANKQYYSKYVSTLMVIGQAAYALPSDFIQVLRLEYVTSGSGVTAATAAIEMQTPNEKMNYFYEQGTPFFYTLGKDILTLNPVPATPYEMRMLYSYLVADMSSDLDEPDAPEQYHEYIAILATRDCLLKDGRPLAPIDSKLKYYEDLLKQIAVQRNMDKPRMIVSSGEGFGY